MAGPGYNNLYPSNPKPTPAPGKKKKKTVVTTTTTTTPKTSKPHIPGKKPNPNPSSPGNESGHLPKTEKQLFLDKQGGAAAWKAKTAARWAKNHPNAQVEHRPGIEQTVLDNATLAKALFATPAAYTSSAHRLADAMYNANLTGSELTAGDTAARQGNITNIGTEYLKQLAGIQLADANAATGAVGLFSQGAAAADQAANSQAIAAGGGTAGSTAPAAAVSLGTLASNTNNILAGDQSAGAKQNLLFHRQESENQRSGLAKLGAQKAADFATEYDRQQTAGDARVANDLTYNLYNQQNTTKRTLGNKTIDLNTRIAKQKAWAATADRAINEQLAQIKADVAAGKISPADAAAEKRAISAKLYVTTHLSSTSGSTKYHIPVTWPRFKQVWNTTGGPSHDGYEADGTTKVMKQVKDTPGRKTITVSADVFQAFKNSGPVGSRKLGQVGAPAGARLNGKITSSSTGGSTGLTPKTARIYLAAAGLTPAEINAFLSGFPGA